MSTPTADRAVQLVDDPEAGSGHAPGPASRVPSPASACPAASRMRAGECFHRRTSTRLVVSLADKAAFAGGGREMGRHVMGRLAALTSNRVTRMGMASALGLGSVVGLGLAADAATGRVRTGGDNLVVRSGSGTSYAKVGRVSSGTKLDIMCQARGTTVKGRYGTSDLWDKIGPNRFVSDAFVYTGSDGRVAPLCQGAAAAPTAAVEQPGQGRLPLPWGHVGVDRWNFYKGQCTCSRRGGSTTTSGSRSTTLQGCSLVQRRELGRRGSLRGPPSPPHPARR